MTIPLKLRLAVANEIRKEGDRYKRELAFLPVAQGFKNMDEKFPIYSFAEECGFSPSELIGIVGSLK